MTDHLKAYPKIFALGTRYVETIFDEPVEATEKIDGSQFVFGRIDGEELLRGSTVGLPEWYKEQLALGDI